MNVSISPAVTSEGFSQLPETMLRRELIDGEVIEEMTAPELDHQGIVGCLFILFKAAAKARGGKAYIAPVDVELDDTNVPQPDVIWLAPDSACIPLGKKRLLGAPDLIAEVLLPSTSYRDRVTKFRLYERFGVREYWIVDPRDPNVQVWQLRSGKFEHLGVFVLGEDFESSLIGTVTLDDVFLC